MRIPIITRTILLSLLAMAFQPPASGQGTAFTYQGRLAGPGGALNGNYDFTFTLFPVSSNGTALAAPLTNTAVAVTNGLFTVPIDFGTAVTGAGSNWLEIAVRTNGGPSFTTLTPRQQLSPTPYAITAESVIAGGITTSMLASGAVTSDKVGPGAIKGSQIDDGGSGAYQSIQQTLQGLGGDSTLSFSNLFPMASTNGAPPSFTFTINGAPFGTVIGFSGSEGISQPYSYAVEVQTTGGAVNPDSEIGLTGRLTFTRNGRTTSFGGIVTACALACVTGGAPLYVVRMESSLAPLALNKNIRVFQSKSVPDTVAQVCTDILGSGPTTDLSGSYTPHELFIQYRETDLNFVSRLMEEEGIFYFFNQSANPPNPILGDNSGAYLASPNSPFNYFGNGAGGLPAGTEYVQTFQKAVHQSTLTTTVDSYNFTSPNLSLVASNTAPEGVGEDYEFGNDVQTAAYNAQLAQVREDRQGVERAMISGTALVPDLRAGYTFTLSDRTGTGLSGSYLVVSVHHAGFIRVTNGVNTCFYGNQFEVIPASLNYRPALATPKPKAQPCTAVVTGPAGEEIYTDKYGRVKVQFQWDRQGQLNQSSSPFIRLASPIASSNGRGMFFLPRIGDEVLVSFIEGDPDQPIIVGSLYNGNNMPPYALPGNMTKSTIRSTGTKGQPTQINEIRFEDKVGSQELYLSASKDMNTVVANNSSVLVANSTTINSGNTLTLQASNINLTATHQITITGPLSAGAVSAGSISATSQTIGSQSVTSGMNIDQANVNTGNVSVNALTFGAGSGEGLASQRTAGANQYDLLLFTDFLPRLTIINNGNVGIGVTNPAALLQVGTATCNGSTWQNGSDRATKDNFEKINPREVLEKVSALPITEWKYKTETNGVRHLGPVAQDFHAAFGLNGADDKHIATVDEEGVALAAIQGLNQKLEERDAEVRNLKEQNEALARELRELAALVKGKAEMANQIGSNHLHFLSRLAPPAGYQN